MTSRTRTPAFALAIAAAPAVAFAGQPAADEAQAPPQGPMQVEKSHDGFVIAPEYKVTHFDHGGTGQLVGAYGGWMIDNRLLIGAGGDWLTGDTSQVRDMGYFGGIVEWLNGADRRSAGACAAWRDSERRPCRTPTRLRTGWIATAASSSCRTTR